MRAFRASSSSLSPSWKSMARLALPSRLELKRPEGSSALFDRLFFMLPASLVQTREAPAMCVPAPHQICNARAIAGRHLLRLRLLPNGMLTCEHSSVSFPSVLSLCPDERLGVPVV